jgi:hypothetical protein
MAKAKLSKGFELFGEHLLPLGGCRRGAGVGEELSLHVLVGLKEVCLANCLRDVSGLSDILLSRPHFS